MSRPALHMIRYVGLVLGCLMSASFAIAEEAEDPFADADLYNAAEINEVCAGCHGEYGQGGKISYRETRNPTPDVLTCLA